MSQEKKMIKSPLGTLELEFKDRYLVSLKIHNEIVSSPHNFMDVIDGYFEGRIKSFDFPLQLQGTTFQKKVWMTLQRIPYGQTWSYSQLAQEIGSGARAVANACAKNPLPLIIPCHRVLRQDGALGGYSAGQGVATKSYLLRLEGAL